MFNHNLLIVTKFSDEIHIEEGCNTGPEAAILDWYGKAHIRKCMHKHAKCRGVWECAPQKNLLYPVL